jgi:hypothetical protein
VAVSLRASGIRIEHGEGFVVGDPSPPARPTRRTRKPPGASLIPVGAAEAAAENEALVAALQGQAMEHVDTLAITPTLEATPPTGRRRRGAPGVPARQSIDVTVPLAPGEGAVILLEQDSYYSWTFPGGTVRPEAAQPRRRRTRGMPAAGDPRSGGALFTIDVRASAPTAATTRRRRGLITNLVYGGIKAIVFRFIARPAVGKVVSLLERHVDTGLIVIDDPNPSTWRRADAVPPTGLPADRSPHALLLVHGTFSSTTGGFAALGVHPWGQGFLRSAIDGYDVVLGYDHRTLSVDPLENAADLMERLHAAFGERPPRLDIVCHSRGGLVVRSLIELLGPTAAWNPAVERAAFVAATNGGTLLAEPANWHALVDLHTNLSMAATRALGLLPQTKLFATIVSRVVQGVGVLVKVLVDGTIAADGVPGLAAMEPDGAFVTKINRTQPGQPDPAHSRYYVASSDFEIDGPGEPTSELPGRLVRMLQDGFMDALMKEPNDLVVNVSSMGAIDPDAGMFVDARMDFGTNRTVYHNNYFAQPAMVDHLRGWLEVATGGSAGAAPTSGLPRRVRSIPGRVLPAGAAVRVPLGPTVATDVLEIPSDMPAAVAADTVADADRAYVVVRRPRREGSYMYAFASAEVLRTLATAPRRAPIGAVLDMHEYTASQVVRAAATIPPVAAGFGAVTTSRRVVIDGDKVVGVVPEATPPAPGDALVAAAPVAAAAARPSVRRAARRARGAPTDGVAIAKGGGRAGAGAGRMAPPARRRIGAAPRRGGSGAVTTHLFAEMPGEIVADEVVSIQVDVSREGVARAAGRTAARGDARVEEDRPLIIQAVPRANIAIEGNNRAQIPVPAPGAPEQVFFDVRGTNVGDAEVDVVARQDQLPLLTLVLEPAVVATAAAVTGSPPQRVDAEAIDPAPLPRSIPTLRIWEDRQGGSTIYRFDLDVPELGILDEYASAPIVGNRDDYVQRLYTRIEEDWGSSAQQVEAFQARLRAFGGELLDELVPTELQRALWRNRKKLTSVMVLSEEPFIPWELVHLKDPASKKLPRETAFLGQMGLVRWLHGSRPPDTLRLRKGKARFVIPEYPSEEWALPETAEERTYLESTFGATPIEPHLNPVRKAISTPGTFDLLHFAGHGIATGGSVSDSRIMLEGSMVPGAAGQPEYEPEELESTTIGQFADLQSRDGSRPIVVLNACQVGRLGRQLTSTGGFAEAFIGGSAGLFLSSLWSVMDEPARGFTEAFYDTMLKGGTVADAARAGRARARAAGDATWLAYVVYGNPAATLV